MQADDRTGRGRRVRIRRWWAGIHGGRADKRRSRHALLLGVFRTFPFDFLDIEIVDGCDGWECGATNTVSLRYPRSRRAEEDEKFSGPREDRPLPCRVRGCHCERKEMRSRIEGSSSVHTHPSVPPGTESILPFPSVACRHVGPVLCCGPSRSVTMLSPGPAVSLAPFGTLSQAAQDLVEDL